MYKICISLHSCWWIPCGPAPRPSLSEQQHQVSGLCTWKCQIMSIYSKKSVLSTQLRSLVPIGCSRQSAGEGLSITNISDIIGIIAQNGRQTLQIIYWGSSNPLFCYVSVWCLAFVRIPGVSLSNLLPDIVRTEIEYPREDLTKSHNVLREPFRVREGFERRVSRRTLED